MNKLILPDKLFSTLKWILATGVPAFDTFFPLLVNAWGWDIPLDAIMVTINATATFLAACLGISNYNYKKLSNGEDLAHTEGTRGDDV